MLSAALVGCGGNETSSARDVARIYVDAVSARDWEAQQVVEEIDGRKLVHFEYVLIK